MKKPHAFSLKLVCRFAAPVFGAAFYALLVLIAVSLVAIPIIALINLPASEMLLPPFMHGGDSGGAEGYFVSLGNGLKIFTPADSVSAADIKTAIYLAIMLFVVKLAVLTPICRFLSKLCANVRDDNIFDKKNADYVNFTGLTVMAGELVISFLTRWYNYKLVTLFAASTENVSFAPGISVTGILIGLFILLVGSIYGYACRVYGASALNPGK